MKYKELIPHINDIYDFCFLSKEYEEGRIMHLPSPSYMMQYAFSSMQPSTLEENKKELDYFLHSIKALFISNGSTFHNTAYYILEYLRVRTSFSDMEITDKNTDLLPKIGERFVRDAKECLDNNEDFNFNMEYIKEIESIYLPFSPLQVGSLLLESHPEWGEQIKALLNAYEYPFDHFCKKEAEFRLTDQYNIDASVSGYTEMLSMLEEDLIYNSEQVIDSSSIENLIDDVLANHSIRIDSHEYDYLSHTEENPLIDLSHSDPNIISDIIINRFHILEDDKKKMLNEKIKHLFYGSGFIPFNNLKAYWKHFQDKNE